MKHPASFFFLAALAVLTLASHWPAPAQEEIAGPTPADDPLDAANPALFWEPPTTSKADPFSSLVPSDKYPVSGQKPLRDEPAGPRLPARWQMTIFQTDDPEASLKAANTTTAQDAALWKWLAALEKEGRAIRVSDTEISVIGGNRAHSGALREFTYFTEWYPFTNPTGAVPTAFETRNLGSEAHFTPRARHNGWRLDARLETVQWEGFSAWRMVDVEAPRGPERAALIRQPIISSEVLTTVAPLPAGAIVLLGCGPLADVPGAAASQPPRSRFTRYVFAQALPDGNETAAATPPAESGSVRLRWRAFRVPRHLAAAWLWNRDPSDSDAEALTFWEEQTKASGENAAAARSAGQWSLLAATGPISAERPGGPPQAELAHLMEYIYPTEWMVPGDFGRPLLCPSAYETRYTGRSFYAQAIRAADGATVLAKIKEEAVALLRLDDWPVAADDPALNEPSPHFGTEAFRGALSLPEGGVRFAGARAVLPRGPEHAAELPSQIDLLFLQAETAMPEPEAASAHAPAAPPVMETQVFVFSLPAEKAAAFASLSADASSQAAAIDDLWTLAETGEARVVASLAASASAGGKAEVLSQHESIYPVGGTLALLDRGLIGFSAFEIYNHGAQLEAAVPADPAKPVQVRIHWETAAPIRPAWADYERTMREHSDVPYPRFFMRKLSGTVPQGGEHIIGVIPNDLETPATAAWPVASTGQLSASAPAGSPEYGRTHVVVGRTFARGQ